MSQDQPVGLITGAAGALGGAIATRLAERGVRLALGYRHSAEAAQALAERLPGAVALQLDVTDGESVAGAFARLREQLGPPAILVNSAGITRDTLSPRMSEEAWQEVLDTNLSGAFRCIQNALRDMLVQRYGRIVTLGSISGALGPAGQANYAAAKAGLLGMTKSVSREVARRGITVNVVAPGLVKSQLSEQLDPQQRELYTSMTATRREVDPDDVATAVLFCLDCPSLTGQVINVDGGVT